MDNTLQIRLSADISLLTSELAKAKKAIKGLQDVEKGNEDAFKPQIGTINALTAKINALKVAKNNAFDEKDIARFNKELEEAGTELTRLNALGRSVTANLGSTAGGFGRVAKEVQGANAVALEFNRVIQDSPFGLLGIGNNLQQLATQFSSVSKSAGGAGKAIAQSFTALISPVNLGLLAISALTAGFTAYQMGAFDSLFATEDLGKSVEEAAKKLEDYRNSLDAVTRASIEGASNGAREAQSFELLRAQAENANIPLKTRIEAVKELQTTFPDYLGNLTQEQILTGNVGTAYEDLTTQIIATAKARAFSDQIAENSLKILTLEEQQLERANKILEKRDEFAKAKESVYDVGEIEIIKEINDLSQEQVDGRNEINRLKDEEVKLTSQINQQIEQGAKFTEAEVKAVKALKDEYEALNQILISRNIEFEAENSLANFSKNVSKLLKPESRETPIVDVPISLNYKTEDSTVENEIGLVKQIQQQIQSITALRDVATDPTRIQNYNAQLQALQQQLATFTQIQNPIAEQNKILLDSFSALGIGIASSLDISNNAFKGFITTVLSATPKIIQAILAQSAAKKLAAKADIATNSQVAGSEGIAVASKAANALGPVGLALLPVFIGGALALISGAFNNIGGGGKISGGGGGSASVGRPPQIFTNSQIPRPPGSSAPTPTGNIDFGNAQGRLEARIDGNDIVFVYDRTKERQQGGG